MNILVIDGNSIINRAFYGVRPLSTRDGRPTHAIYGFMTMLNKILEDTQPDSVAVAFDMRAPTFRHLKYSGYKAKRKGMPEELASQMQPLKDILAALGYRIVTAEGWEADDILGTIAHAARQRGDSCVIATGDRDTLQLVGGGVTVRLLSTKEGRPTATVYDEAAIVEKYGVEPPLLLDIKAIQGDTSDNIPGVPGIGEKGALDLVSRFGTLEKIYENIDSPDIKAGTRKKLLEGRESAELSRWLGEVRTDAPVPTDPAEYVPAAPDSHRVRALMTDLELFSLLKKLDLPDDGSPAAPAAAAESAPPKEVSVSFDSAEKLTAAARSEGAADLVVGWENDCPQWAAVCREDSVALLDGDEAREYITQVCCDGSIAKRTHDCKCLARWLFDRELRPEGFVFDTALAAYLINPSASDYELDKLIGQYLGVSDMTLPPFLSRAAEACRFTALCRKLATSLEEQGLTPLLRDIELPLSMVLAEMEHTGFAVDAKGIELFGDTLNDRIGQLESEIWQLVGYEFNINSPKQLGQALFEKLGLPGGKKTKTGYSTSADALDALRGQSEAVDKVLEYRGLAKLSSTYCKGMLALVGGDGRLHTTFQQTETRTGRISSTEPNLQNIPVRTELGRELRRYFIAGQGNVLIDADYSQIELRVLAHMAQDSTMINAFNNGADIHRLTAAQTHGIDISEVTPTMRSEAKAVNFGIVYGISAFSLAKDIGVTREAAQRYIDGYMSTYSGVAKYMTDVVSQARADGYARTMLGRRRYLPELAASNFNVRSFGERVARNMPIQGTAADIIKLAMVRASARLRAEVPEARLIMQVHDELIVECPAAKAAEAARLLEEEMRGAFTMDVCLEVDAHTGANWLEAKG